MSEVRDKLANKKTELVHYISEYFKEVEKNLIENNLKIAKQKNIQRIEDLTTKNKSKLRHLEQLHDNLVSPEVSIDALKYVFSKNKQKLENKVIVETESLIQFENSFMPESSKVKLEFIPENIEGFFKGIANFFDVQIEIGDFTPEAGMSRMYMEGADDSISLKGASRSDPDGGEQLERTPSKKLLDKSAKKGSTATSQIGLDNRSQFLNDQKKSGNRVDRDKSPRNGNNYYGQTELVEDQRRPLSTNGNGTPILL